MRKIFAILGLLLLISLASATVSPIKTDFQNYIPMSSLPATQGDWYFDEIYFHNPDYCDVTSPDSYGHIQVHLASIQTVLAPPDVWKSGYIINTNPTAFQYAAWTITSVSSVTAPAKLQIFLYNAGGGSIGDVVFQPSTGRYELVISGGTATLYLNDAVVTTFAAPGVNPSFLKLSANMYHTGSQDIYIDDIILGYATDSSIVGPLPGAATQTYYIYFDSTAPSATGLYRYNASGFNLVDLKNSNYWGMSYGRAVPDATTIRIINPSGTLVNTSNVANMSAQVYFPMEKLYQNGIIQNGRWSISLADDSASTSYFYVLAYGASIAWNADQYSLGETGTVTYVVSDSAWNISSPGEHYFFNMQILDAFGNIKQTTLLSTQSGSLTYQFPTTAGSSGVYYAQLVRTNSLAPITTVYLGYDTTNVLESFGFYGYVNDAVNVTPLPGATVSFTQLGSTQSVSTPATGYYNFSGFLTGATINISVSKGGWGTYTNSLNPTKASSKMLNFTLNTTNISCLGICLFGTIRDTTYGNPINYATVNAVNGTDTHQVTGNNVGWYLIDTATSSPLTNATCYNITATKTAFRQAAQYLKCVTGR